MWSTILDITFLFIQSIIGFNLIFPFVVYLIYTLKNKNVKVSKAGNESDYAIIVTAYEQVDALPGVINSIRKINYHNYLVYIVADKCNIEDLSFDDPNVILLKPEETLASNTRSHFYAIKHFRRNHDRLTIIDSDNLLHPEYLNELNYYFDLEFEAVQGIREAKNLNTKYACLDAARDIYYHFYDGKILFTLGSSATLAGSGMAFTTGLYKECLENLDITGAGFDKVLQFEIVKRNKKIAFASNAIVFDEKTSQTAQLVNQRSRWINTWFKYSNFGFTLIFESLKNFSWNQFLFGLVLLRPPLFIFLILSVIFMLINIVFNIYASLFWFIGILVFVMSFFIPILNQRTDKRILNSLIGIPKFMFFQVISLINARSANERSVATQHYQNQEDIE
ncbi:glycosyltransferase [Rubrolithibacter danxiaensis]|uniref:glycosyltransferase n=1 Tax=Rubrolithibacter danxiaensis TaxID=3390805 RepID=UPI003BF7D2C1